MRVFSEMSCVDGTYQNTFPVNLHEMGGRNVRHWIWNPPKTANFSIFWAQNGGYNGRTRQKSLSYTRHEPGRHIRMIYIVSRLYLSGDYVRFIKHVFSDKNFCPIIDQFSHFWPPWPNHVSRQKPQKKISAFQVTILLGKPQNMTGGV